MKKKYFLSVLVIVLGLIILPINVQANNIEDDFVEVPYNQINVLESEKRQVSMTSEPSLGICDLVIGINKNGICITYSTRATQVATEIGVKDMVLQEKTILGWRDIPVKDHYDYDTELYFGSVVYLSAETGKTYRVYCTHYAIIDDVEYTLYNETDSLVFN